MPLADAIAGFRLQFTRANSGKPMRVRVGHPPAEKRARGEEQGDEGVIEISLGRSDCGQPVVALIENRHRVSAHP
jgi:hypothetical protein